MKETGQSTGNTLLVGGGVAVVLGAIGAGLYFGGYLDPARETIAALPTAEAPALTAPDVPEPGTGDRAQSDPAETDPVPPRIDEVRVERDGLAIIAGKAAPGSTVSVLLDGEEIATVAVDSGGSFATVTVLPSSGQAQVLTLIQRKDGVELASVDEIILAPLPDTPQDQIAAPSDVEDAGTTDLALASPDDRRSQAAPTPPSQDAAPAGLDPAATETAQLPEAQIAADGASPSDDPAAAPLDTVRGTPATGDAPSPSTGSTAVDIDTQPEIPLADAVDTTTFGQDRAAAESAPEATVSGTPPADAQPEGPAADALVPAPEPATPEPAPTVARTEQAAAPPPAAPQPTASEPTASEPAVAETTTPEPAPTVARTEQAATPEAGSGQAPEVGGDVARLAGETVEGTRPSASLTVDTAPLDGVSQTLEPSDAGEQVALADPDVARLPEQVDQSATIDPDLLDQLGPIDAVEAEPMPAEPVAPQATTRGADVTDLPTAETPTTETGRIAILRSTQEGIEVLSRPEVLENVSIDTISYSSTGAVQLSGRAGDGSRSVRVYVNNRPVATLAVDPDGRWRGDLPNIDTGVYRLRVDELTAEGSVVSRLETPFKREDPEDLEAVRRDELRSASSVVVQTGNTLWAIARDRYGDGFQYVQIFDANRESIRDPDLIFPGQVFDLPDEVQP